MTTGTILFPRYGLLRGRCGLASRRWAPPGLWLALALTPVALADPAPRGPVSAPTTPVAAFEEIWNLTREQVYPPRLVDTHFDFATYQSLRNQVSALDAIEELPDAINPFLDSLGVSHTQLYASYSLEYAFFRSLFATRDPSQPPFSHLGVQLLELDGRWYIRETLDGFPADQAGLERGDELLTIDREPFDPRLMCDGGERRGENPHFIEALRRETDRIAVEVACVRQNPHASMHQAIENSARTLTAGDSTIGYLRLWTGTGPGGLEKYRAAIASLMQTDAMILDLRGGFGGAWYEHLDPFFSNREGFFAFTVIDRDGSTTYDPEPRETTALYDRPMAVLINEGTRSGKEAVAYQFKKSARAPLIGTRTRGAFSAGKGLLLENGGPLVYYLAVAEYRLDGHRIEGAGVTPDIPVPYPVSGASREEPREPARYEGGDPQVAAALEYLEDLLAQPKSKS